MAPCRSHHRNHTRLEWIIWVIRQELNPVTCKLDGKQINQRSILRIMDVPETSSCRYAELIRLCIPYNQVASLDVVPDCMPRPPALVLGLERERTEEGKKREKFYIYLDVTHTLKRIPKGAYNHPWTQDEPKNMGEVTVAYYRITPPDVDQDIPVRNYCNPQFWSPIIGFQLSKQTPYFALDAWGCWEVSARMCSNRWRKQ